MLADCPSAGQRQIDWTAMRMTGVRRPYSGQTMTREEDMAAGFTDEGLAALDATLAQHTATGAVPGLV